MSFGSSNDNSRPFTEGIRSFREPVPNGLRFVDVSLVDALLQDASELAQEAYSLIERSCAENKSSRSSILETLQKNRDAFLTTTRLSHSVAWLLAAKEVLSERRPAGYLKNFELASVRSLSNDPYIIQEPIGESVAWVKLLRRSNEIFRSVIDLNDLVATSMTM